MHTLALQLAPVLAAEKSKTAFYIVGGVLIVWAFGLSLGIGTLRPDFPSNSRGERIVIAISAVLVVGTLVAAVATSGSPEKTETAAAAAPHEAAPSQPAAPSAPATSGPPAPAPRPGAPATPATKHEPTPNSTKLALSVPGTQLAYNTKLLNAKAGAVTITMTNMSPLEHNVTIAEGAKVLGATATFTKGAKAVTLNLKPGKYTFYCSVPGHRAAGMEGTLIVK